MSDLDPFGTTIFNRNCLVKTLLDDSVWDTGAAKDYLSSTLHVLELDNNLEAFLARVPESLGMAIGKVQHAVYAFFDIDGECLYVGQTAEEVSTRLGRHLRGQRSDCVAKRILDPHDVFIVKIWVMPHLQNVSAAEAKRQINALEYLIHQQAILDSKFGFVLNEKSPKKPDVEISIPESFSAQLLSDAVASQVLHPDVRIARYSQNVAELAQIPAQRKTDADLRKVLQYKSERLTHLITMRNRKLAALTG